jgi:hypothetical protein
MIETITWNKFFTGSESCSNYKEYKERLDVHTTGFIVVDDTESQGNAMLTSYLIYFDSSRVQRTQPC